MSLLKVTRLLATRLSAPRLRLVLAFAAIYLLWGGTFLAIRVAVMDIPPLFASGVRFFIAGGLLYVFMRVRGQPIPSAAQWRGIGIASLCMFVLTYAALFWAAQFLPSGITSVIEATLPISTVTLEVFVFRQQRFHWRTAAAVAMGFLGVAVLLFRGAERALPVLPCLAVLAAGVTWSLGAVLTRSLPRPRSAALVAGAQMLLGGAVLLMLSGLTGELSSWPVVTGRAVLAVLYLIVAGSLISFTAYLWLLTQMPVTRVASHAYVNPLVAVALGYFVAGEPLTPRMLVASTLVILSVFLLLKRAPNPRPQVTASQRRCNGNTENLASRDPARTTQ
jgi:drug/metabolite transporter (DMT)-like permease